MPWINDTPHSLSVKLAHQLTRTPAPPAPKKPPRPTMPEKIERLAERLRKNPQERVLFGKGKWQYATSGNPISSVVAKEAVAQGVLKCLDPGGLFGDEEKVKGQTWALADV